MSMDDATWARHASPWSVWTRFSVLPLMVLAIWSRVWIGWWALIPVILVVIWTWVNPRLFPPPPHTNSWAARGTFGERVWLNRKAVPVPAHHVPWAYSLSALAGLGLLPMVWGLWQLDAGWIFGGLVLTMGAKTWFVDRMVWLYEEMAETNPTYKSWMRKPPG